MVRGKVIDAKKQPVPERHDHRRIDRRLGPQADDQDRQEGRVRPAADRVGHVSHHRERSEDRLRQQRHAVVLGKASEMTIVLAPSTAANDAAKAAELKKVVRRRRHRQPRRPARRRDREVQRRARHFARLLRLPVQHRRRADGEEGREGRGRGVEEGARDEARLRRGPQRAVDALQQPEALRRSRRR